MLNKRGYSYGAEYPFHCEDRGKDGWAVFDARTDEDKATGLKRWEAFMLTEELNGLSGPTADVLNAIDATP